MNKFCLFLIFHSMIALSQWENKHGNLGQWYSHGWALDAFDSLTAIIAADQSSFPTDVLFKTTDGGITWEGLLGNHFYSVTDVSIVDPNHFWICTAEFPNQILATTDGGITWQQQYEASDTITAWFNYIKMFDLNNGIAMGDAPYPAIGKPAAFLKTTDGGENWILLDNPFINAFSHLWYNIDFISPEIGFFKPSYNGSSEHKIFKTTDGGDNWTELNYYNGWVNCLKFFNEQYGFAHMYTCSPYTGTYILRTTNSGITWDSVDLNFETTDAGVDFEFVKNDPSKVWLITYDSLYFSPDSGKTWLRNSLSSSFEYARDLVIVDDKVCWFLCETVFRNLNADHITYIDEHLNIPEKFYLYQNYPNPFNPVTNIDYEIKERDLVSVKIYDILGKEVDILVDEEQSPGKHSVKFNGENLSSGVYFYKLQTGSNNKVKSMMLLK